MKITVNGIGLHCAIDGPEGRPWLTFSNSLATDLRMWDAQVDALDADFRILRYDKRGHGGSDAPAGPYTFDMLVGDVVGLWDALGIERSHFVGLSIGGMTGMGLGIGHADRLLSLVIANSRADMPPADANAWNGRIALAREQGMDALAPVTVERWCSRPFFESGAPALETLRAMVANTSVTGYVGCARALQTLGFEPFLGEIATRTLFIAGAEDVGTPADNMQRIAAMIPGTETVVLSPAGHISCMEKPEAFNAALKRFFGLV